MQRAFLSRNTDEVHRNVVFALNHMEYDLFPY